MGLFPGIDFLNGTLQLTGYGHLTKLDYKCSSHVYFRILFFEN
jgi:hypothetical protein